MPQDPLSWLSSSLGGTSATSEQLSIAAEIAGSRARGAVTQSIRAKASQRLAASAATRRLLHLWGDGEEEGYLDSGGGDEADSDAGEERDLDGGVAKDFRFDDDDIGEAQWSSGAGESTTLPRRTIKVAQNTTLGRMVQSDPERAAKYNLVAVPAWQQNKPWPPPPVPLRRRVPGGLPHLKRRQENNAAETDLQKKRNPSRDIAQMTAMVKMKAKARKSTAERPGTRRESFRSDGSKPVMVQVDLEAAQRLITIGDVEFWKETYARYSMGSGGRLDRKGLQLAMKAVGIGAPVDWEAQWKVKSVQEEVIRHFRGTGESKVPNPLTDAKGFWELQEFVLLVAGVLELDRQDRTGNYKELAERLGLQLEEVGHMARIFREHDEDGSNSMSLGELQRLLAKCDLRPSIEELKVVLGASHQDQEYSFEDFVNCIATLSQFMKPNFSAALLNRPESRRASLRTMFATVKE